MQPRELPFSRIRIARHHQPPATTVEQYQKSFRIAYTEPTYPPEANGAEGVVSLDAVIGKDGSVLSVDVRSGDPGLANAALAAVRQWAYRPLKVNGRPVEVATEIDVLVKRA
jgi:TonB family protein